MLQRPKPIGDSDQYSLGAILYEILTGRPPFLASKSLDTVMEVINSDPVAPSVLQPDVDRDIETICLKALRKERSQRYESCQHFAEDLQRFLDGQPMVARPVERIERAIRWCRRNPVVASSSLAAVVCILTAFIVFTVVCYTVSQRTTQPPSPRPEAPRYQQNDG